MNDQVKNIIRDTVLQILQESTAQQNIRDLTEKHKAKVHFIPLRYRIIGGFFKG